MQRNFVVNGMDGTGEKRGPYEHSWWRIFLIIFAIIAFIVACIFNGLASTGYNGRNRFVRGYTSATKMSFFCLAIFNQQTGNVSNQYATDFTPAGKFDSYHRRHKDRFLRIKGGHFQFGVWFTFGKQHGYSMLLVAYHESPILVIYTLNPIHCTTVYLYSISSIWVWIADGLFFGIEHILG